MGLSRACLFSSIFGLYSLNAGGIPTPSLTPSLSVLAIRMSSGIVTYLDCRFSHQLKTTEVDSQLAYAACYVPPLLPSTVGVCVFVGISSLQGTTKLEHSERLEYVLTLIQASLPVYWIVQTLLCQATCFLIILATNFFHQKVKKNET